MDTRDIVLAALMVLSAIMLTYKWLSLYDRIDGSVIFFAFLLTLSLGGLLLSIELRMQKLMEELESTKRAIIVNTDDLESRLDGKLASYLEPIEARLERIERRMYR